VDPRAGLDDVEKRKFLTLPGLELRICRPACSQSLYRLSYAGSSQTSGFQFNLTTEPLIKSYPCAYFLSTTP
jgi:hypothetical protein